MSTATNTPEMLTRTEVLAMVGQDTNAVLTGLSSRYLHAHHSEDGSNWVAEKDCVEAWIAGEPCGHDRPDTPRRLTVKEYKGRQPVAFAPILHIDDPRWAATMTTPAVFFNATPEERGELFLEFVHALTPLRTVAQMTDCGFADCDWNTHNEGKPASEWSHAISRFDMNCLEGSIETTGAGDEVFVYADLKTNEFACGADIRELADDLVALKRKLEEAANTIDAVSNTVAPTGKEEFEDLSEARAAWDAEHGVDLAALRPAWADDRDPVDGFGFGGPGFQDVAFESAPFEIYGSTMRWVRSGVYNTGSRTIDWDSDARLMLGDLAFRSVAYLEDYLELLREGADAMAALHDNE